MQDALCWLTVFSLLPFLSSLLSLEKVGLWKNCHESYFYFGKNSQVLIETKNVFVSKRESSSLPVCCRLKSHSMAFVRKTFQRSTFSSRSHMAISLSNGKVPKAETRSGQTEQKRYIYSHVCFYFFTYYRAKLFCSGENERDTWRRHRQADEEKSGSRGR